MDNEINMDIDTKVCFLCNEENLDMTSEIASLKEPMSEIEQRFILELCPLVDRDTWATEFHAAPTDPTDIQPPQNTNVVISKPSLKLELCFICG